MPPEHCEVVSDIIGCRTEWMGGHIQKCDSCGEEIALYNSCRNRHCSKCQSMTKERWLEKRKSEVLPVNYFHNVFTVPHEANPVFACNKKTMINILFRSASETLLAFGANPANGLGGKIGSMMFLHSWTQMMLEHYHVHCTVPAGALSDDGSKWIRARTTGCFRRRPFQRSSRASSCTTSRRRSKTASFPFTATPPDSRPARASTASNAPSGRKHGWSMWSLRRTIRTT